MNIGAPSLEQYLILAALLFCIGLYGVLVRRHAIGVLMCIELMLNAVNLNLVAFARFVTPYNFAGQIFALFVICVAVAEIAVGLALVITVWRSHRTSLVDKLNLLKW